MAKSNADRRSASSRRGRRRGGYPPGVAEPEAIPFEPTPVDEEGFTKWVIDQASELVPGAVDEVLGHALDNAINARVDQWVARLNSEFAKHVAGLRYRLGYADSTVIHEMRLQAPDTHRIIETETARNCGAVRLRGEDEKAAWSEPGYADPTLMAGRTRGAYIYLAALVAAAAADIAAFYQVIQLVLADLSTFWVIVLVIGFTGTALATAHFTGIMLRDLKAGAKWIPPYIIIIAAAIWLTLGALAFWVRLRSNIGATGAPINLSVTGGSGGTAANTNQQGTVAGAAMFGGLYAATGLIALVGSYLSHNPLRAAFSRAMREHRSAAEQHATGARRLRLAEAEREFFESQLTAAEEVRKEAARARHALAAELKQRARLELAKRLRDASTTDAFLQEDARPYIYPPLPN